MAIILYIGIIGVLISILEIELITVLPLILLGLAVVILEIVISKSGKIFIIFNAALSLSLIIFTILNLSGIKLLFNHLFLISEKYQMYKYFMFSVDNENDIVFAYAIFIVFFAMTSSLTVISKSIAAVALNFIVITGIEIYFGVFGSSIRNIFFYTALVLLLVNRTQSKLIIVGAVILSLVTVGLFFNYDNPEIAVLSEQIRDWFGDEIESETIPQNEHNDINTIKEEEFQQNNFNDFHGEANANEFQINTEYNNTGPEAGLMNPRTTVNWLLLCSVVILLSWTIVYIYKKVKRSRQFNSVNYAEAVNSMFLYVLRLFEVCNLIEFDGLHTNVKEITSPSYAAEYADAVAVWYETLYSDHEITTSHTDMMKSFVNDTVEIIYKKIKLPQKLKNKFLYFL